MQAMVILGPARPVFWGERLRRAREDRHLTVRQMADGCGVSLATYTAWEAGDEYPVGAEAPRIYGKLPDMRRYSESLRTERTETEAPVLRMAGPLPEERVRTPLSAPLGEFVKLPSPPPPPLPPAPEARPETTTEAPYDDRTTMKETDDSPSRKDPPPAPPPTAVPVYKTFGQALRAIRHKHGVSGHEVGRRCGVSSSLVGHWERGSCVPQPPEVEILYGMFEELLAAPPPPVPTKKGQAIAGSKKRPGPAPKTEEKKTEMFFVALDRLMQERGYSNRVVAEAIEVSTGLVGRWRKGDVPIPEFRKKQLQKEYRELRGEGAEEKGTTAKSEAPKNRVPKETKKETHEETRLRSEKIVSELPSSQEVAGRVRGLLSQAQRVLGSQDRKTFSDLLHLALVNGLSLEDVCALCAPSLATPEPAR